MILDANPVQTDIWIFAHVTIPFWLAWKWGQYIQYVQSRLPEDVDSPPSPPPPPPQLCTLTFTGLVVAYKSIMPLLVWLLRDRRGGEGGPKSQKGGEAPSYVMGKEGRQCPTFIRERGGHQKRKDPGRHWKLIQMGTWYSTVQYITNAREGATQLIWQKLDNVGPLHLLPQFQFSPPLRIRLQKTPTGWSISYLVCGGRRLV